MWRRDSRLGSRVRPEEWTARFEERRAAAEVVFLGELDHFVREKTDFRLAWCEWLVGRGHRCFVEELAHADGVRVQQFLESGDEGWLARCATYGYTAHLREDRDDLPSGILRESDRRYPTAAFAREQWRFYRGLREIAERHDARLRFHGCDVDGRPGIGYELIAEDGGTVARVPGERLVEERERLGALAAGAAPALRRELEALQDGLAYIEAANPAPDYGALAPAMALREAAMKRRVAAIFEDEAGGPAPVLLGHALHLARDDADVAHPEATLPGGDRESSLGHHLVQECGRRAFSVWMLFARGEDSQPMPGLPTRLRYPRDTLNRRLAARGAVATYDTDASPWHERARIGHLYGAVFEATPARQCDALSVYPSVSPLGGGS